MMTFREIVAACCIAASAASRTDGATVSVTAASACSIRLQAAPVAGAAEYRWFAQRSACGPVAATESAAIGTSAEPTIVISTPIPFDATQFRVDPVSPGGTNLGSQYSGFDGPRRAGPPTIQLLGFESAWADPSPGATGEAYFWVESTNTAIASFQWYRNSTPIAGATGPTLNLPVSAQDDGARISVRATNSCGTTASAERVVRVAARPPGSGVRWLDLTELSTLDSAMLCCPPNYGPTLTNRSWATSSTSSMAGVTISPNGATMSNSQSGGTGRFTKVRSLAFSLPAPTRLEYSVTQNSLWPATSTARIEGSGVNVMVSPGAGSVDLAPGTYRITVTSAAGSTCCFGGMMCLMERSASTSWSISFGILPLCDIDPGHPSCCPADLDRSRTVDGIDLGMLLSSWGSCGTTCPADLNLDGSTDGADLGRLLNDWGSCGDG